jgi:hypothetical protein
MSIAVGDDGEIIEPFESTTCNERHKVGCEAKTDADFEVMDFMKKVKTRLDENPYKSTQQVYEEARVEHKALSDTTLPDFKDVASGLNKRKAKLVKTPHYSSSAEIVGADKFTTGGHVFYFFDNHKKNRSFGFVSPTGLACLAESQYYHADGTFHTKTRYMAQL